MQVLEAMTFCGVLSKFRALAGGKADRRRSDVVAMSRLVRAEILYGSWKKVRLTESEAASIFLPWHMCEGGSMWLVPLPGSTVAQAAARLVEHRDDFSKRSPACWLKIAGLSMGPRTPVFLSAGPIGMSGWLVPRAKPSLLHLDGLHRLVSWQLAGTHGGKDGVIAYAAGIPDGVFSAVV